MSTTGPESSTSAADAWLEVQFAQPNDPAPQSGNRQAMEKLLIDAQRESGQSSLVQSGSASPVIVGSRSPPIPTPIGGITAPSGTSVNLLSSGDWERDWPGRSQQGWQKCKTWHFMSLRKTALMRWPQSLLLSLLSHAASFLLGAASMYIVIGRVGTRQHQPCGTNSVGVIFRY